MKYSKRRNTIHRTFGVLQSSLKHKVVFCLPTLLFQKTFANKNVLDVVAKPMFTFSKHVFLRECSMYRVTSRICHIAQKLQLTNEKTKHNVLDVMAAPDVYSQ